MTESAIITRFRRLARAEVGIAPYDNKQLTTRLYNKKTFKQKETLRYVAYKDDCKSNVNYKLYYRNFRVSGKASKTYSYVPSLILRCTI